ncbi:MAG TPA: sulfotransferase family 2 domain-containing protein [Opitutaceae bacterium]
MIISVHVPKCAGTSFRHVLHGISGDSIWYNYGTIFSKEQAQSHLVPPGTKIIHGHFMADSFDGIYPERQLITWVRHPVERVVSNYYHFLRSPDMRDNCCKALHEHRLSLREFADLDWMQNLASRYLSNKPVADFHFIGISERFHDSLRQFCSVYGYREVMKLPRENTNPERTAARYDLRSSDQDYILERNIADFEWYSRALERLQAARAPDSSRVA